MQKTVYTKSDFDQALERGQDTFEYIHFDFFMRLEGNYEQKLGFFNCRFTEDVSFVNASFLNRFTLVNCHFHQDVDFSHASFERFAYISGSTFHNKTDFKRTIFNSNVSFSETAFMGETSFEYTFFINEVSFYKTRFLNNIHFHRAYMGVRADFSYATFSREHTTSFFSMENSYSKMNGRESDFQPPVFIFRYVYFTARTLFTNVDLSRSLFQDSYIIPIIFKNCTFSKTDGRNCFYQEKSQVVEMKTNQKMYERIDSNQDSLTIRLNDELRESLQIGDRVIFVNSSDPTERYEAFLTWIYRAKTADEFFEKLKQRMPYKDFDDYQAHLSSFYSQEQINSQGLIGFSFKRFNRSRHWENLEDINRQMKRSLEDSRDWQKAGDFYSGEMSSMTERLKHSGEKRLYRYAMRTYGFMTGYCESVYRILVHMLFSFSISLVILYFFTGGSRGIWGLMEYNLGLFIPLLGGKFVTLRELDLLPWQNVVMMLLIIWYYLIWFFLALTLQRKFRR